MPKRASSTLIVRLPNWVGDTIMALPTLELLERAGFSLHLFGRGWIHDLLAGTPYTLHTMPKTFQEARNALKQCPASRAVLLTNSFSSALHFRASGKEIIGYRADGRRLLLNQSLKKPSNQHEVVTFYQLGKLAITRWASSGSAMQALINTSLSDSLALPISSESQRAIWRKAPHLKGQHYLVICPFATGTTKEGHSKIWPHWVELCKHLTAEGKKLVICPGPGEVGAAAPFKPYTEVLEELSLSEYAQIMKGAAQVIANDSGPMHIAAAIGAPVLGIFGVSDPDRTYPWGGRYIGSAAHWPTLNDVIKHCATPKNV